MPRKRYKLTKKQKRSGKWSKKYGKIPKFLRSTKAEWDQAKAHTRASYRAWKYDPSHMDHGMLRNTYRRGGEGHIAKFGYLPILGLTQEQAQARLQMGYKGRGDYGPTVSNSLVRGGAMQGSSSQIHGVNLGASACEHGNIIFSHTEFIANITAAPNGSSSPFSITNGTYPLNAALTDTFPFLGQIAANFDLYEFDGLIFQYKPTSGEYGASSTSNSLGKVIMATNYDPDAGAFINSVQMENYQGAASCKPSQAMIHGVETARSERATNLLYCRTGSTSKDKVFTDVGTFYIATEGIQGSAATTIVGELWVTYRVKLSRPKLYADIGGEASYYYASWTSPGTQILNGTPLVAPTANTTIVYEPNNTLGCIIYNNATGPLLDVQFPLGTIGNFEVILTCADANMTSGQKVSTSYAIGNGTIESVYAYPGNSTTNSTNNTPVAVGAAGILCIAQHIRINISESNATTGACMLALGLNASCSATQTNSLTVYEVPMSVANPNPN